jgi:hypothetical protein
MYRSAGGDHSAPALPRPRADRPDRFGGIFGTHAVTQQPARRSPMTLETKKPTTDKKTDNNRSTRRVPFFARKLDGKLVVKSGVKAGKEQDRKDAGIEQRQK